MQAKSSPKEIYSHYGCSEDKEKVKQGIYESVDFMIGAEEHIESLTKNLAGFGTDQSQRIIIEYDKGFGYFIVKRIPMQYGVSERMEKPRLEMTERQKRHMQKEGMDTNKIEEYTMLFLKRMQDDGIRLDEAENIINHLACILNESAKHRPEMPIKKIFDDEERKLKKEIHIRRSDVEKFLVAFQQIIVPIEFEKAFRIEVNYNQECPTVEIRILEEK